MSSVGVRPPSGGHVPLGSYGADLVAEYSALLRHNAECASCAGRPVEEWPVECRVHVADRAGVLMSLLGGACLETRDFRRRLEATFGRKVREEWP